MQFLNDDDFKGIIGTNTLDSLRGTSDENLDTAENLAIAETDPLRINFDVAGELAKTTTGRNAWLVKTLVHITAYYLFNTVEDNDIPERIDSNFNTQLKNIEKIAAGKMACTLDPLFVEGTTTPKSKYRFGSDAARDNDIF